MPADFELHKDETYQQLSRRYHANGRTVSRWLKEMGAPARRCWRVLRYGRDGEVAVFRSIGAAAESVNGRTCNIYNAIQTGGTAYGYSWDYEGGRNALEDLAVRLRQAANEVKLGVSSPGHAALMIHAAEELEKQAKKTEGGGIASLTLT